MSEQSEQSQHSSRAAPLMEKLRRQALERGYHLNPDADFVLDLMDGLITNQDRYGYASCPCIEAEGLRKEDLDILCPCDYRDADLAEFGSCYCGLYVSAEIARGERAVAPIPLRRSPNPEDRPQAHRARSPSGHPPSDSGAGGPAPSLPSSQYPLWRCSSCGYLAARDTPPLECPVCHATSDRFERISEPAIRIWRCTVCGYLAARQEPPLECPVCWASQDRFELLS